MLWSSYGSKVVTLPGKSDRRGAFRAKPVRPLAWVARPLAGWPPFDALGSAQDGRSPPRAPPLRIGAVDVQFERNTELGQLAEQRPRETLARVSIREPADEEAQRSACRDAGSLDYLPGSVKTFMMFFNACACVPCPCWFSHSHPVRRQSHPLPVPPLHL
jgi:hypothetical protein